MGGHVFLECMSIRMTCPMRAYVLREVMLCTRKFLWEAMRWWSVYQITCLFVGIRYRRACLAVQDVLLEYMFYRRAWKFQKGGKDEVNRVYGDEEPPLQWK